MTDLKNASVANKKIANYSLVYRMGKKAKFMITGDPGQIDLPKLSLSGLKTANNILQKIEGIEIVYLDGSDVIRHKLVTSIIDAYNKNENI